MRYLTILLAVWMLSSCSWSWPWQWGDADTGNCLDNDSCDEANPFEEQLIGGTWYCYGKSKDEPWDCSQDENASKIAAVAEDVTARGAPAPASRVDTALPSTPAQTDNNSVLAGYADSSYAVQLIAVQTIQEVERFAAQYELESPNYVLINTQGDNWYVVLLGIFDDKVEADAAADNWNDTHQPFSKPWVRELGPLKAAARLAESAGA